MFTFSTNIRIFNIYKKSSYILKMCRISKIVFFLFKSLILNLPVPACILRLEFINIKKTVPRKVEKMFDLPVLFS